MQRPFDAYEGDEPYVFVCYAHDDKAMVYPEIARLKHAGTKIWYDEGIAPGSEWSETLAQHIDDCALFLFLVTPRSVASEHCRHEINYALEEKRPILAVHLEPTELPRGLRLSLNARQAILRFEYPKDVYETKLARAIEHGLANDFEDPNAPSTFKLGDWTLNVGTQRLTREDEVRVLDPKAQSVLLHLVDRAPELVSREGLIAHTWPGVVVGDNVLDQAIAQLRRAFGDDARKAKYIETLPKRGYRLLAPITTSDVAAPPASGPAVAKGSRFRRHAVPTLAAVMILLLGLTVAYWYRAQHVSGRQRVAVATFMYPSGDERLENYATLFRDELMHQLSRAPEGRLDLVQTVDDADFVTKGSVTEAPGGVRLFVQVVSADEGTVIWSNSLELPPEPTEELLATRPEDLATMVALVARWSLAASRLTESDEAAREYIAGEVAYNEAVQGLGGGFNASLAHLRRASELDPQFILPLFGLANYYKNRGYGRLRYADAVGPAREYVRRILAIDENQTGAVALLNRVFDHDYDAALANLEYARRPGTGWSDSVIEFETGLVLLCQGKLEEALERFNTTLRIGATGNKAATHNLIGLAYLAGGRYEAAVRAFEEAVVQTVGTGAYAHVPALTGKVAALYGSGDRSAARDTLASAWATYGEDYPVAFAGALALLGETDTAEQVLRGAEQRFQAGDAVNTTECFWGAFYLGDLDRAFVWLNRDIEERGSFLLPWLRRSPLLDPIRGDPRYIDAMARLAEIEAQGTSIETVAYP